MRESAIERAVCARAKAIGAMVVKLNGPGQRGLPDRMFLMDGRVLFVEFKAPGKKPTALQVKTRDKLVSLGFTSLFCDNKEMGTKIIDFFLNAE